MPRQVIDLRDRGRRQQAMDRGMQNVFRGLTMMENQKARERALKRQQKQDEFADLKIGVEYGIDPSLVRTPEGQRQIVETAMFRRDTDKLRKQQERSFERGLKEKEFSLGELEQQSKAGERSASKRLKRAQAEKLEKSPLEIDVREQETDINLKKSQILLNKAKAKAKKALPGIKPKQWNAAIFARRMEDSEKILDELKGQKFDFGSIRTALVSDDYGNVSFVASSIRDPKERRYISAAWNWITAKLREESGAAISAEEFANDCKIFFPQAGSGTGDVLFKKRQRDIPFIGFKAKAGEQAYAEIGRSLEERRAKRQVRKLGLQKTEQYTPEEIERFEMQPGAYEALKEALADPDNEKSQRVFRMLGRGPSALGQPTRMQQIPTAAPRRMQQIPTGGPARVNQIPTGGITRARQIPTGGPTRLEQISTGGPTRLEQIPTPTGDPRRFNQIPTGAPTQLEQIPTGSPTTLRQLSPDKIARIKQIPGGEAAYIEAIQTPNDPKSIKVLETIIRLIGQ